MKVDLYNFFIDDHSLCSNSQTINYFLIQKYTSFGHTLLDNKDIFTVSCYSFVLISLKQHLTKKKSFSDTENMHIHT